MDFKMNMSSISSAYRSMMSHGSVEIVQQNKHSLELDGRQYEIFYRRLIDSLVRLKVNELDLKTILNVIMRFLIEGESIGDLGNEYMVKESKMYEIINSVLEMFNDLYDKENNFSTKLKKWQRIEKQFWRRDHFPNCIGALGAYRTKAKTNGTSIWSAKYKCVTFYAIADSYQRIIMIDTLIGKKNKFTHSDIYKKMLTERLNLPEPDYLTSSSDIIGPMVFVARENFKPLKHLCVPYPRICEEYNAPIKYFNARVDLVVNNIDVAISNLIKTFKVFKTINYIHYSLVGKIFKACAYIYNCKIDLGKDFPKREFEELPFINVSNGREKQSDKEEGRVPLFNYFSKHINCGDNN